MFSNLMVILRRQFDRLIVIGRKVMETVWRQSGIPFLWEKAKGEQPTLFIWLFAFYIAAFGLASQRHENHRDRLDNKIAVLAAQMGTPARNAALARVAALQRKTIPPEPDFVRFWTTAITLFGVKEVNQDLLEETKTIVASILKSLEGPGVRERAYSISLDKINIPGVEEGALKALGENINAELSLSETTEKGDAYRLNLRTIDLSGSNLRGAHLQDANLFSANLQDAILRGAILVGADLQNANLQGAILRGANLQRALLWDTNLQGADLRGANLVGANLFLANLQGAFLRDANLQGADLWDANLQGADLQRADLRGVRSLECDQLKLARNWELAYRDEELGCGAPIPAPHDE